MATYVMSDIHGCFDEFQEMLARISLSGNDRLVLAGDYIDRGPKSREMLEWLEECPDNIIPIRGNHDIEFAEYVRLMQQIDESCGLMTDAVSNEDTRVLLETLQYLIRLRAGISFEYFDYYGTVTDLIMNRGTTLEELARWAHMLEGLPLFERFECSGRDCAVAHAGFCDEGALKKSKYSRLDDFCIYAREEVLDIGGMEHGMVIFGHTPTIIGDSAYFNSGRVFNYHDSKKDCVFINIDCGCAYRRAYPSANLACLRADDGEVLYLYD
ncbi:MAG: metallophosphoesterase [Lachnospiraceae bacterium]|nr:metallophosphoesterase [Lachnospiraceae bacterium]